MSFEQGRAYPALIRQPWHVPMTQAQMDMAFIERWMSPMEDSDTGVTTLTVSATVTEASSITFFDGDRCHTVYR